LHVPEARLPTNRWHLDLAGDGSEGITSVREATARISVSPHCPIGWCARTLFPAALYGSCRNGTPLFACERSLSGTTMWPARARALVEFVVAYMIPVLNPAT
jgi:hypothetical protein